MKQLRRIVPWLVAAALGVACSAGSTQQPKGAPPEAAPEPEASPEANPEGSPEAADTQGALAVDEPAPDPAVAEYEATTAEGAAPAGGSALSDGETRTMQVIQKTVLDNRARFRTCYDATQDKEPEVRGDMTIYFILDSQGRVREAALNEERSTLKHPEIAKCIVGELRKIQFAASSKGLETKVNYPFNFNPK